MHAGQTSPSDRAEDDVRPGWLPAPRRIPAAELTWPGLTTRYARLPPHGDETVTGPGQVGVAFTPHDEVRYRTGGRRRRASYPGGSVICSGDAPITWSDVRGPTEALEMYPAPEAVADLLDGGDDVAWPVERCVVGAVDPVVLGVASVLRRAHVGTTYLGETAASWLGLLLTRHVLAEYAGLVPPPPVGHTRLSRTDTRRVHDLVEAELHAPLSLQRLAEVAHLSPYHFARCFRATTGLAPHTFVTSRRMDRARVLLAGTDDTVAEVASAVGFTNLSHFRRVFRAHAGASPTQYRAGGFRAVH